MRKIICDRCSGDMERGEGTELRVKGFEYVLDLCDKCCGEFEAWLMEKEQDETMGEKANAGGVFEIKQAEGIARIRPLSPIRAATTTEG